jgi:hypothetical protein
MEKEKNSLYALAQALYRKIFFKKILNEQIKNFNGVNSIEEWEKLGRPSPPPAIYKQQIVSKIQKDSHVAVLIETGTFMGDMIYANLQNFKKIYSIEIQPAIHNEAKQRFVTERHVTLLLGNSPGQLRKILDEKNEPAIFWLDSHYSGGVTGKSDKDTPIIEELSLIFAKLNKEDIILIDDARYFVGTNDYPTIEGLKQYIYEFDPKLQVNVKNDIIAVAYSNIEPELSK